jgi:hypothetical protein
MLSIQLRGAICLPVLLAMLFAPTQAGAECVTPSAATAKGPGEGLVFSGRVEGLNQTTEFGVRVTFNVGRVWKGAVSKRFDLYVWELNSESARFEFQRQYIVFAYRMSEEDRQRVGLTPRDPIAFTATSCGAVLAPTRASPDPNASTLLRELGEGQPAK